MIGPSICNPKVPTFPEVNNTKTIFNVSNIVITIVNRSSKELKFCNKSVCACKHARI